MPKATATAAQTEKLSASEQKLALEVIATIQPYLQADSRIMVPEIKTNDTFTAYAELAKTLKGKMGEVDEAYDDLIDTAHKQHKAIIAKKKRYWQPLSDLCQALNRAMNFYTDKKERERQAEEQRLREQARQQEQDRLVNEAAQLESEGKVAEAINVMQEAQTVEAPVITVQSSVPKVAGVYQKSNPWTFEIIDSTKIRDEYWIPDEDAIKAIVKAKGPAAETIIGQGSIRVKRETTTVTKA